MQILTRNWDEDFHWDVIYYIIHKSCNSLMHYVILLSRQSRFTQCISVAQYISWLLKETLSQLIPCFYDGGLFN